MAEKWYLQMNIRDVDTRDISRAIHLEHHLEEQPESRFDAMYFSAKDVGLLSTDSRNIHSQAHPPSYAVEGYTDSVSNPKNLYNTLGTRTLILRSRAVGGINVALVAALALRR